MEKEILQELEVHKAKNWASEAEATTMNFGAINRGKDWRPKTQ